MERVFCPVSLLQYPYDHFAKFPYFEISEILKSQNQKETKLNHKRSKSRNVDIHPTEFYISFEKIENPAICALEICSDTFNPLLLSTRYFI